jgi:hypothetical protein
LHFNPHFHTTHAETEAHIKIRDAQTISQKLDKFQKPMIGLCLELPCSNDGLKITLQ